VGEMTTGPISQRLPSPVERQTPMPTEGRRTPLPAPYARKREEYIPCREAAAGIYEAEELRFSLAQFPSPYQRPGQIIDIWV
jgi:hypothetical protein